MDSIVGIKVGENIYPISGSGGQALQPGRNIEIENATISAKGYKYDTSNLSFAEGADASAIGVYAHAEGEKTEAYNRGEHAEGRFNRSHHASQTYGNAGNTQHSIGIGTANSSRKNAVEVMQNGDVYIKGLGGYLGSAIADVSTLQSVIDNIVIEGEVEEEHLYAWYSDKQYRIKSMTYNIIGDYIFISIEEMEIPNDWGVVYYSIPKQCAIPSHGVFKATNNQALYWSIVDEPQQHINVLRIASLGGENMGYSKSSLVISYMIQK